MLATCRHLVDGKRKNLWLTIVTLGRPLLPYGYCYKASCAWPVCNFCHPGTLTLSPERQSAQMSKITNDGLTRSGTGCFSGRQRVNCYCSGWSATDLSVAFCGESLNRLPVYGWFQCWSQILLDWTGLCSVLRPRQHSIGNMGDRQIFIGINLVGDYEDPLLMHWLLWSMPGSLH